MRLILAKIAKIGEIEGSKGTRRGQRYMDITSEYLKWPKNIQKIQKSHIMDLKTLRFE